MNEAMAKTKWCPHALVVEKHYEGVTDARNRVVLIKSDTVLAQQLIGTQCLGSDCMAWRQTADRSAEQATIENLHNMSGEADDGYCGLAGKP